MIRAALLGIVQGLTEFFPVSSSGHLFLLQRWLGRLDSGQDHLISFFIFLHVATLGAVLFYLRKNLHLLFTRKFSLYLIIATLLTGCVGLLVRYYLSHLFLNKYFLAACFFSNAFILLSIGKISGRRDWKNLNTVDAVVLGLLQGVAFLPGVSRSGITITGFLRRGFKKEEAFVLSFLMAIPAIIGAFMLEYGQLAAANHPWQVLLTGFMAAFLSGIAALAILEKIVVAEKFKNFSYYCLLLAIVTLFL